MKNFYDVVIPCGPNDVKFVPKVVMQLRKHLLDIDYIYIITNGKYIQKIENHIDDQRTKIIDENTMLECLHYNVVKALMNKKGRYEGYGWIFQQLLKFGFAQTEYASDYYLTWDADTLPIQNLSFFEDGHPIFTKKSEYHKPYFKTNERLIGIGKVQPYSFIAEHMVFKKDYVKELLSTIEKCNVTGNTWVAKCINACEFTMTEVFSEFELYGSYVSVKHPDAYKTRLLRSFRNGGLIKGRYIDDKLLTQLAFDLDIVSFEYKAEAPFPYNLDGWWWRKFRGYAKWKNMPLKEVIQQALKAIYRRLKAFPYVF